MDIFKKDNNLFNSAIPTSSEFSEFLNFLGKLSMFMPII